MNERYRIHQVITAAPGTRMMMKFTEDDDTTRWEAVPVLLFALVENLEHGGDRFVVPMDQSSGGLFEHSAETKFIGMVLAPGEPVPADYDGA
jgi:hypothetical protein